MNISIAKYTLLAAVVGLAACKHDDDDGYALQPVAPAEGNMIFAASFEAPLSKAALHVDGNNPATARIQTYFQTNDALSLFDGVANNKFTTTDNGASVSFEGTAKTSESGYYALFPYNQAAKLNADGSISTTIPTKQSFKSDAVAGLTGVNSALEGIVAIAHTDNSSLTLKNATAIIRITTNGEISSSIKVESSEAISGDVNVSFDQYNNPVASGATSKVVELTDAPNGGYISILPVENANFKVTYTLKDGTKKEAYFQNVTVRRSEILNFGDIDKLITVTFDVSGLNNINIPNVSIKPGGSIILPSIPNMSSCRWLDSNGNPKNQGSAISNITEDISFVIITTNDKVLVFSYNNKTSFKKFTVGSEITMLEEADAPEGHHLIGWDFSQYAQTPQYAPGQKAVVSINNTTRTIYAYYDLNDVKVTLDANGGLIDNKATKEITHKWGVTPTITDEAERAGYWFKGWDVDNLDPYADATVKAIWGTFSKIIYHDFDGTVLAEFEQTYKDGESTTIRNDIKLSSLIESWNEKQDGTGSNSYIPGQQYKLTGNINLYPVKSESSPSSIDDWNFQDF